MFRNEIHFHTVRVVVAGEERVGWTTMEYIILRSIYQQTAVRSVVSRNPLHNILMMVEQNTIHI